MPKMFSNGSRPLAAKTLPIGLYLHIPFCHRRCHYCDFVITTNQSVSIRKRFLEALAKEVRQARKQYDRLTFETLYLGGGTPSVLEGGEAVFLVTLLREHFDFQPDFEFCCEMNPEDVVQSPEKMEVFRQLGVNRVSLGAQSFRDDLLKHMGRFHRGVDIEKAIHILKETGFQNINLDLIIRLPGQTLDDVRDSLDRTVSLGVPHVSIYDLDVHRNTVYGSFEAKGKLNLPDEDTHLAMAELVETCLEEAGFCHYELLNYARPGFQSRHNLIYWHNQEYLGLGPGAFSYLKGIRYQFARTVTRYLEKCEALDWSPDEKDSIDAEKREWETLLTGLRLREGISLDRLTLIRGHVESKLSALEKAQLVQTCSGRIALTRRGRFLAESAFLELLSELAPLAKRF